VLNVNDVVESVEQLLIRTLGEHVELITDLADNLHPVLADPGQIEQVLINLAVNAQARGHVRIYSEPGLGTVVTALLPVTRQDATPAAPPPAERQRGHGETVLVVEDETAMREVTRRILARNGYHVIAVASGHDALTALTRHLEHIDVLLTDVILPHMQGSELEDLQPDLRPDGASGWRMLAAPARGGRNPGALAALGDHRLKATPARLEAALTGRFRGIDAVAAGMLPELTGDLTAKITRLGGQITRLPGQIPGIRGAGTGRRDSSRCGSGAPPSRYGAASRRRTSAHPDSHVAPTRKGWCPQPRPLPRDLRRAACRAKPGTHPAHGRGRTGTSLRGRPRIQ
jgi:CheY-like chemotaxis protein